MTHSTAILQLGDVQIYRITLRSKVLFAQRCLARPLLADKRGKFFVISGVFSTRDLDKLGEIIGVIRTQDPKQTQFHTWSAYTLGRSAGLAHQNILDRIDDIEDMQSEHSLVIETITKYWQEAKSNSVMMQYLKNILVLHACKLLNARTTNRLSAGDLVASSSSLVDSLGRHNPGAKSAQITAANSRLDDQLEFDVLSRGSAEYRREVGRFVELACDEIVTQIVALASFGNDEDMTKYLPRWIKRILVKPYTYAIRSISDDRNIAFRVDPIARQTISGVFLAERSLAELDSAMSRVHNNTQMFFDSPDLLDELIDLVAIETHLPEYADLQDQIKTLLAELTDALAVQDTATVRKSIKSIKNLIRHRDIHMLWPMHDTDGTIHPIYR
jgi:uncharacterized protein (UPF0335 family)